MIVDANLLLYAVDQNSPHHLSASAWVESVDVWATTNRPSLADDRRLPADRHSPSRHNQPFDSATAWGFVTEWLVQPQVWIPPAGERTAQILGKLLAGGVTGNLIPDAQLASLAIEYGVPVASNDSDFAARFPECRWFNPLR